jgi:hypothetical protein
LFIAVIKLAVKTRRPLIHLLLVLMLLLTQQLSFAHLMNHALAGRGEATAKERKSASGKLLVHQSCQECLSFAHIGSALPVNALDFCCFAGHQALLQAAPQSWVSASSPAPFLSRAPPQIELN